MPRNGSGTMALTGTFALANQVPASATINSYIDDIVDALTESINIDGTKAFAANQPMGGFKFTGLGSGNAAADSLTLVQAQNSRYNWADAGGTADALTGSYTPAVTAVTDGDLFFVRAASANATTTPTFTPNSGVVTARTIVKNANGALVADDIAGDGHELILRYRASDTKYELMNPKFNSALFAALASANTFTASQTITSTDAGAAFGPSLTLDRNSASPDAADVIGALLFYGRDSGAASQDYASIAGVIVDPTAASEDGALRFATTIAGTGAARARIGAGIYTENATSGDMGVDTVNASEYYKNGVRATRHLLATLTTTSGTTHSVTDIPAYRELYIEVIAVSFSASATMTLAVSDDNGANYGTARAIAVATGSAAGAIFGTINVSNIQHSGSFAIAHSVTAIAPTASATQLAVCMAEAGGGGGIINAIQFAGGTFDAGVILVYGLL